jgi:ActR/RegA family two-component response regulator
MAENPNDLRLELSLLQRPRREPRSKQPPEATKRVLIVVDDRLAGRQLARMLTARGYEGVRAVSSAARALILAKQCGPAIVFLDVTLSDDAYGLAHDLKRQAGRQKCASSP